MNSNLYKCWILVIINLSRKEKEVLFMPKENIFSGKYEPDRDTCTEANESNVARFRTAMLKLDRIHNDDNEKDLTENIMQLCSRNNKTGEKLI